MRMIVCVAVVALLGGCDRAPPDAAMPVQPTVIETPTSEPVTLVPTMERGQDIAPAQKKPAPSIKQAARKKTVRKQHHRSAKRRAAASPVQPLCVPWSFDPACYPEQPSR